MNSYKLPYFLLIPLFLMFYSCQNPVQKNQPTLEQQAEYIAKGKLVSGLSLKALSKEVMDALEAGGVKHAVDYCNVHASPLIDSLSKQHKVQISRVSDKYRNPDNKPGELDLTVLKAYREQLAAGDELQPHLEVTANDVIFYSPILILNPVCLNCHGEPGTTAEQGNIDFIKTKYPDDRAVGYKIGDLRGVWKIILSLES
jgi:hypothetical protein